MKASCFTPKIVGSIIALALSFVAPASADEQGLGSVHVSWHVMGSMQYSDAPAYAGPVRVDERGCFDPASILPANSLHDMGYEGVYAVSYLTAEPERQIIGWRTRSGQARWIRSGQEMDRIIQLFGSSSVPDAPKNTVSHRFFGSDAKVNVGADNRPRVNSRVANLSDLIRDCPAQITRVHYAQDGRSLNQVPLESIVEPRSQARIFAYAAEPDTVRPALERFSSGIRSGRLFTGDPDEPVAIPIVQRGVATDTLVKLDGWLWLPVRGEVSLLPVLDDSGAYSLGSVYAKVQSTESRNHMLRHPEMDGPQAITFLQVSPGYVRISMDVTVRRNSAAASGPDGAFVNLLLHNHNGIEPVRWGDVVAISD